MVGGGVVAGEPADSGTAGDAMLALLLHALAGSADGSHERGHWDDLVRVVDGQGDGLAVGAAELAALRRKPDAGSAETVTRVLLTRSHDDESFRNDFSAWRSQEPIQAAERSLRDAAINAAVSSLKRKKGPRKNKSRRKLWEKRLSGPWLVTIAGGLVVIVAGAIITPMLTSASPPPTSSPTAGPGAGQNQGGVKIKVNNNNHGEVGNTINNNYPPGATSPASNPEQQITQLTGSYNVAGFEQATFDRENSIVALYLKSGMPAATIYNGASVILYGFEIVDSNNDPDQSGNPVTLAKTFLAGGFKIDTQLYDSTIMTSITGGLFPSMFNTSLTPEGYTGGYQNGTFVGSLLFWIVQKSLGWGPTDQDIAVIKYLISQGADCAVPLSYLKYSLKTDQFTADETGDLIPILQSCTR
jgi:hypothetical protein